MVAQRHYIFWFKTKQTCTNIPIGHKTYKSVCNFFRVFFLKQGCKNVSKIKKLKTQKWKYVKFYIQSKIDWLRRWCKLKHVNPPAIGGKCMQSFGFTKLCHDTHLSHPCPVWSVWRVMVVSRWERERGHTRGHRLRCAAGNTGWGPVPGM